jgi:hypothetical protein
MILSFSASQVTGITGVYPAKDYFNSDLKLPESDERNEYKYPRSLKYTK